MLWFRAVIVAAENAWNYGLDKAKAALGASEDSKKVMFGISTLDPVMRPRTPRRMMMTRRMLSH